MEENFIYEGNKLIADYLHKDKHVCSTPDCYEYGNRIFYTPEKMGYHTSWRWLMPVVENIASTTIKGHPPFNSDQFVRIEIVPNGFVKISNLRDTPIFTNVSIEGDLINATYKAVVEFIKWHNQQVK